MSSRPCERVQSRNQHRQVLNGLLWKLNTGAQRRDVPERYDPWKTLYDRFVRWRRDGLFERILEHLRLRLGADGRIDVELWCTDGSSIRASRSAAGGVKGGSARYPAMVKLAMVRQQLKALGPPDRT